MHVTRTLVGAALFIVGCGGGTEATGPGAQAGPRGAPLDATPAIEALRQSRFEEAESLAAGILARDPGNAEAHAVAALTSYKRALHDLVLDGIGIFAGAAFMGAINQRYAAWSLNDGLTRLEVVAKHLESASRAPDFALELCLACWQVDWNKDGEINWRDQQLLEIEVDADGSSIPEGDPRRRPTFRFDIGDLHWASAMVSFQRAVLTLVSAYDYSQIDKIMGRFFNAQGDEAVNIELVDKARIAAARDLVLAGLDAADRARLAYLAEKDDAGEWLPNPQQKSHPLPLPVTPALYDTWASTLRDVRALVAGKEGLDVAAAAQLGDHEWQDPPRGFLDVGRLFTEPGDLVLNAGNLRALDRNQSRGDAENVLRDLFGNKYVSQMKPSPLTATLKRIGAEVERGEESAERKLRYLLWLN